MSNASSRRISIAALTNTVSQRAESHDHSSNRPTNVNPPRADEEKTTNATVHPRDSLPGPRVSAAHGSLSDQFQQHRSDTSTTSQFLPPGPSFAASEPLDNVHQQHSMPPQMDRPSSATAPQNSIEFEFYTPQEPARLTHVSTSGPEPLPLSAYPHQGSALADFVFERPSSSSKAKKEKKAAPSGERASTGKSTPKAPKKPSKDSNTTSNSQVDSQTSHQVTAVPEGHQDASISISVSHRSPSRMHTKQQSDFSQHSVPPDETTAEDDIMADLDMAEHTGTGMQLSSTRLPETSVVDFEGDLDMEILSPMPPRNPVPAPSNPPGPKKVVKKSASSLSMATPSPAPSTPVPAPAAKKTAPKAKKAQTGAKAAATKKKAEGGARTKAEASKAKSSGDDWARGGTSGRAAAAAATNALLQGGGYDEGLGNARDGTPFSAVHGAGGNQAGEDGEEDSEEVDTRLYCICREMYDNRFMLGCDNCDEWFHPPCLGMEDFQCDLLEHFYCANCRKADPSLVTSWRTRCSNGLQHPFPESADACWRAALPPLSKYCSRDCGVEAMERKIAPFIRVKAGISQPQDVDDGFASIPRTPAVKTEMTRLWKGVKDAKKRDAVVATVSTPPSNSDTTPPEPGLSSSFEFARLSHTYTRLGQELNTLTRDLQLGARDLEFILARGRLAKLAIMWSDRPENLARCCFDSRLLMEGKEWEEWVLGEGRGVLEGGVDAAPAPAKPIVTPSQVQNGDAATPGGSKEEDGAGGEEEEFGLDIEADSPWCDGRRKCERHFGWQKLCMAEFELNKGTKELALQRIGQKQTDVQARLQTTQALLEALDLRSQDESVKAEPAS